MNNVVFGKYVNNNSLLTKLDTRFKLLMTIVLIVFCFLNLNIYAYLGLFIVLIMLMIIGKLKFSSLLRLVKHMWLLFLIVFIVNIFNSESYGVLFEINNFVIHKGCIYETLYIILRIIMILMVSTLLTSSSSPQELTYAMEFYLTPLKLFKIEVHEIALMMSIALRFIPTLIDESNKIMKAQASRGVDFNHGKYKDKVKAITSLIIPLFVSCFHKAEDLNDAMIVKGYGMGERSKYYSESFGYREIVAMILLFSVLAGVIIINGVVL